MKREEAVNNNFISAVFVAKLRHFQASYQMYVLNFPGKFGAVLIGGSRILMML